MVAVLVLHPLSGRADAQPAGTITGTVTNATTAPLANVYVFVYDSSGGSPGFGLTDAAGVHTVTGLAAGKYYVQTSNVLGYVGELHNNLPCSLGSCVWARRGRPASDSGRYVNSPSRTPLMKSVMSAVRSMADKSRLDESAAAGRHDRAELWGLEGAVRRRIGAMRGCWDGRADGEGGDPARHAWRGGVIVGTQAGRRPAGDDRPRRRGGAGDHEESSKAGVAATTGRSPTVGTRATMAMVPV
jgi:hypothetical protein